MTSLLHLLMLRKLFSRLDKVVLKQLCISTEMINSCLVVSLLQAYEKLSRGKFPNSLRIQTFIYTVSRLDVSIRHVSIAAILPTEFASRNAPDCNNPDCQVCNIRFNQKATVGHISMLDILDGKVNLAFIRMIVRLRQGTRPISKKLTIIRDVKCYLGVTSLSQYCILVTEKRAPFAPHREHIVVLSNIGRFSNFD